MGRVILKQVTGCIWPKVHSLLTVVLTCSFGDKTYSLLTFCFSVLYQHELIPPDSMRSMEPSKHI